MIYIHLFKEKKMFYHKINSRITMSKTIKFRLNEQSAILVGELRHAFVFPEKCLEDY